MPSACVGAMYSVTAPGWPIQVQVHTRSSACVPAVAGTHAPGRGEGVEGLIIWLGDIISAVNCCRRWNGQKSMPSDEKVDDTQD